MLNLIKKFPRINKKKKTVKRKKPSVSPSKKYINNIAGVLFVIVGVALLFAFPTLPKKESVSASEPIAPSEKFTKDDSASIIERILLPKEDIDLEVKQSKIVNGYWETSETTASHGEGSANPGEKGNIVVFAHAREGLFYNLKDVKKDDVIYLLAKNGWYKYKVVEIKTVYPNQVETVQPTKDETLTLFTCSGFFDEKRLIVKAKPI